MNIDKRDWSILFWKIKGSKVAKAACLVSLSRASYSTWSFHLSSKLPTVQFQRDCHVKGNESMCTMISENGLWILFVHTLLCVHHVFTWYLWFPNMKFQRALAILGILAQVMGLGQRVPTLCPACSRLFCLDYGCIMYKPAGSSLYVKMLDWMLIMGFDLLLELTTFLLFLAFMHWP